MVTCKKAILVRNYLLIEVYWPCAGGLSAVNANGAQMRDPINSGLTRWRLVVLNIIMDAAAEIGRNPVCKHQIQPEYGDDQADAGAGLPNPSRETKFSGANADREIFIFPVQLTTCRIGNLTRLIHTLDICDDHTYILLYLSI